MADLTIKKDNYGFDIQFTVKKADETLKDLTGYTVTLKVWKEDADNVKFSGTCTLDDDPTSGKCYYTAQETDFDTLGGYNGELELTKSGERLDTKTFTIAVKETAPQQP